MPADWRRLLNGRPGLRTGDLATLVNRIIKADGGFPRPVMPVIAVQHPYDDGVWLGNAAVLEVLPGAHPNLAFREALNRLAPAD